jgi:hypothetical protein
MLSRRTAALATGAVVALAAPTLAVATASAHPATQHRPAVTAHHSSTRLVPTGGVTMLKLTPSTASALKSNGVAVAPVSEAKVVKSGIAFPIQGGLLNPATLAGTITHDGGLSFTAGGKTLTIRDFTVSTTHKTLSAWVDQVGARIPVLNLGLGKAKVSLKHGKLTVPMLRPLVNRVVEK